MMKKLNFLLIILMLIGSTTEVDATAGRLKSNSVVPCNGTFYGNHGDNHWHEAKKNDNGTWSAIGPDLGYTNPCGTKTTKDENYTTKSNKNTSEVAASNNLDAQTKTVVPKETEAEKTARIEAERKAEEIRIKEERIAEEERIRKEKEEFERIEKEKKIAAQKLLQESSIEYTSVNISGKGYKEKDLEKKETIIVHQSLVPLLVNFKYSESEFDYKQSDTIDYFEYGEIDLKIQSANKVNSDNKILRVLRLPLEKDFQNSSKFGLLIKDQMYTYESDGFKLPYVDFVDLDLDDVRFTYNQKEIPLDYTIEIDQSNDNPDKFVIAIADSDRVYEYPFNVGKNPIQTTAIASSLGLGAIMTAIFWLKK